MNGVAEKGFYRLKLDDRTFFLFLLEPTDYKVDINATEAEPFKITGSKENDEFQRAFKTLGNVQRELQSWNMAYQMYSQQGVSPDTMMFVQQQLQQTADMYETLIRDSSKAAKSPLC